MTPAEADKRIILSQQTLAKFAQMANVGSRPTPDNLPLFDEEITILIALAKQHAGKAEKLLDLVSDWMKFRESVQHTLH